MANPGEQFKINLNHNLWGLVIALTALGASEYYKLPTLYWFAGAVSAVMDLSIAVTALAYMINYWKQKRGQL